MKGVGLVVYAMTQEEHDLLRRNFSRLNPGGLTADSLTILTALHEREADASLVSRMQAQLRGKDASLVAAATRAMIYIMGTDWCGLSHFSAATLVGDLADRAKLIGDLREHGIPSRPGKGERA